MRATRIIVESVSRTFGVPMDGIVSRERGSMAESDARMAAMVLMREITRKKLSSIGAIFHRDHSAVVHALQRARKVASVYSEFGDKLEAARTDAYKALNAKHVLFPRRERLVVEYTDDIGRKHTFAGDVEGVLAGVHALLGVDAAKAPRAESVA